jgi:hypothetical protein
LSRSEQGIITHVSGNSISLISALPIPKSKIALHGRPLLFSGDWSTSQNDDLTVLMLNQPLDDFAPIL